MIYVWQRRGRLFWANGAEVGRDGRWTSALAPEEWLHVELDDSFATQQGFLSALKQETGSGLCYVNLIDDWTVERLQQDSSIGDALRESSVLENDITFFSASLGISGRELVADVSIGFNDEDHRILRVFPDPPADFDTLARAAGPAIAIMHGTVDLESLVDALKFELHAIDPEDVHEFSTELRDELGADLDDLFDMFGGEIGIVLLDDFEDALEDALNGASDRVVTERMTESLFFYLAVEDRDEVENVLERLEDLEAELDLDNKGDGVILDLGTSDFALGLNDDALWFGEESLIEDVLTSEGETVRSESRALMSALPGNAAVGAAVELSRLGAPLAEWLDDEHDLDLEFAELLQRLALRVTTESGVLRLNVRTGLDIDALGSSGVFDAVFRVN